MVIVVYINGLVCCVFLDGKKNLVLIIFIMFLGLGN